MSILRVCYMSHHSFYPRLPLYENTGRILRIGQILAAAFKCQFTD